MAESRFELLGLIKWFRYKADSFPPCHQVIVKKGWLGNQPFICHTRLDGEITVRPVSDDS